MDNFTSQSMGPKLQGLPIVAWISTAATIPVWFLGVTLIFLLIRSMYRQSDPSAVSLPLRSHLLVSLYQLFGLYPANLAYMHWSHIHTNYKACLVLIHINLVSLFLSMTNTSFYVVAVYMEIVHPMYVHIWFSSFRRRLAFALVWIIPVLSVSIPMVVFMAMDTGHTEISYCFSHVLIPGYVYLMPVFASLFLLVLLVATYSILKVSLQQANQIIHLNATHNGESEENIRRMRAKLFRTYLVVAVVNIVFVITLIAGNVAAVSCTTEACVYALTAVIVIMSVMDNIFLTLVKFRVGRQRIVQLLCGAHQSNQ